MGLFSLDSLRDEAKTFPHSEDMSINWESFPSHAKKKETVNGLWTNPFKAPHGLLDLLGTHLF